MISPRIKGISRVVICIYQPSFSNPSFAAKAAFIRRYNSFPRASSKNCKIPQWTAEKNPRGSLGGPATFNSWRKRIFHPQKKNGSVVSRLTLIYSHRSSSTARTLHATKQFSFVGPQGPHTTTLDAEFHFLFSRPAANASWELNYYFATGGRGIETAARYEAAFQCVFEVAKWKDGKRKQRNAARDVRPSNHLYRGDIVDRNGGKKGTWMKDRGRVRGVGLRMKDKIRYD